jgi:hypothetical protein
MDANCVSLPVLSGPWKSICFDGQTEGTRRSLFYFDPLFVLARRFVSFLFLADAQVVHPLG